MGFGFPMFAIIICLGLITAAMVFYPLFQSGLSGISDARKLESEISSSNRHASISIQNISIQGDCSSYNLTLTISNNGSSGIEVGKLTLFDNGVIIVPGNASTTSKFYSIPEADGYIQYAPAYTTYRTYAYGLIGVNRPSGIYREYRSYLSFNTSDLPDSASIYEANLYTYFYSASSNETVTRDVLYGSASNAIGALLDNADWGKFTSFYPTLDFGTTYGWRVQPVPVSSINTLGDSDFTLRPVWNTTLRNYNYVQIYMPENTGSIYDPYLAVTYMSPDFSSIVLAPSKTVNLVYYNLDSAGVNDHDLRLFAGNGALASGNYVCS